ncbi:MAG: type II toxin-antitoxin system RelE/ParE family toxin, partial [Thermoleophilia bacterium]|nr:type II toxin-antitoxin system RelE/ParE family toxin [Thermoleophilia bacterium]
MRVVWTEHASAQLDEAMAFIARDRPNTATAWLERILDAGESLAELPDPGRVVPEVSRDDLRELIISPYRLVYPRDSSTVTITMVLHERRELSGEDTRINLAHSSASMPAQKAVMRFEAQWAHCSTMSTIL